MFYPIKINKNDLEFVLHYMNIIIRQKNITISYTKKKLICRQFKKIFKIFFYMAMYNNFVNIHYN